MATDCDGCLRKLSFWKLPTCLPQPSSPDRPQQSHGEGEVSPELRALAGATHTNLLNWGSQQDANGGQREKRILLFQFSQWCRFR